MLASLVGAGRVVQQIDGAPGVGRYWMIPRHPETIGIAVAFLKSAPVTTDTRARRPSVRHKSALSTIEPEGV
jgi:hypothetical protein